MTIATFDQFGNARVLHNEINRMFERNTVDTGDMLVEWFLLEDIKENTNRITIKTDLSCMEQKDIYVNVVTGHLSMSGKRALETDERPENYHRVEMKYGKFSGKFQLPEATVAKDINASFNNRVLVVYLPKA